MNKKQKLYRPLVLSLLFSFIYYFFLADLNVFQSLSLKSSDILQTLALKFKKPNYHVNDIVVVAIDSGSLKLLEQTFPLKRDIYASLLNTLRSKEPKVIAFDIVFPNMLKDEFENDMLFSLSLKNGSNVVLPSFFDNTNRYILPHKLFAANVDSIGHLNKKRDQNTRVRTISPLLFYRGEDYTSFEKSYAFEIEIMANYLDLDMRDLEFKSGKFLKMGKLTIPLQSDDTMLINYTAPINQFKIIPIAKILKSHIPKDVFYKKIVLIGVIEEIFHDMYNTPIGILPGVIANANAVLNMLSNSFLKTFSEYIAFVLLLVFGLVFAVIFIKVSIFWGFLIVFAEVVLVYSLSFLLLLKGNILFPVFDFVFVFLGIFLIISIYKYCMLKIEKLYFEKLAITDGLTGLYIHRYLMLRLQDEFERSLRIGDSFAFLITDIDHFKNFNDTYGHEIGNVVLKMFATVMRENFRKVDILARYGGEEFCVILPGVNAKAAYASAERFRKTLENTAIPKLNNVKVTVSIGISAVPEMENIKTIEDIIKFADNALYESKETGRNKSTIFKG